MKPTKAREFTNLILELYDDGVLDPDFLITGLLNWMSESDVKEFYKQYIEDEINFEEENNV